MSNSFGNIFRLTSFSESHGPGVGGVIDGFPAGIEHRDMDFVQKESESPPPGQSLLPPAERNSIIAWNSFRYLRWKSTAVPLVSWYGTRTNILTTTRNIKESLPPLRMRTILIWKIRHPRSSRRRTFISTRNNSCALWLWFICQTCLKALGISVTAYTSQVGPTALTMTTRAMTST